MSASGNAMKVMNIHDMNLVGTCNYENVMAAIAMALAMEVPLATIGTYASMDWLFMAIIAVVTVTGIASVVFFKKRNAENN